MNPLAGTGAGAVRVGRRCSCPVWVALGWKVGAGLIFLSRTPIFGRGWFKRPASVGFGLRLRVGVFLEPPLLIPLCSPMWYPLIVDRRRHVGSLRPEHSPKSLPADPGTTPNSPKQHPMAVNAIACYPPDGLQPMARSPYGSRFVSASGGACLPLLLRVAVPAGGILVTKKGTRWYCTTATLAARCCVALQLRSPRLSFAGAPADPYGCHVGAIVLLDPLCQPCPYLPNVSISRCPWRSGRLAAHWQPRRTWRPR